MMTTTENDTELIQPYGGQLVNLIVSDEEKLFLQHHASHLPRIQLTERAVCDLELLATGGFSPLRGFLKRGDYERVIEEMRLLEGTLFPIPITLTIKKSAEIRLDKEIALADLFNNLLAILRVEEIYEWDRKREAELVCGTSDPRHPLVAEMSSWGEVCIAGELKVLQTPPRYDFKALRMAPAMVRSKLKQIGNGDVVAFQTRNPLHRAHEEMTKEATRLVGASLLLHPAVGMTKPGDIDHYTRVRSYQVLTSRYYDKRTVLALLPLAMRMAGPREALWHTIIRRNFGANHLIVGRNHASPGKDSRGEPFYEPDTAQRLVTKHADETGVRPICFSEFLYLPKENRYEEAQKISPNATTISLSGTEIREKYLQPGVEQPTWLVRPEVGAVLAGSHPERHRQGFCLWFTGLSASGKTTTANILTVRLLEHGRQVTLLDGDAVRTHLSRDLGFSKDDRDANIRRIAYVASEIVRHNGVAICAAISPYRATRDECRLTIGSDRFIEVFVNTPLETCEARDGKGMYRRARNGEIKNVSGIDDPYEPPLRPEVILDTLSLSAEDNADLLLAYLIERGFVLSNSNLE